MTWTLAGEGRAVHRAADRAGKLPHDARAAAAWPRQERRGYAQSTGRKAHRLGRPLLQCTARLRSPSPAALR